MVPLIIYNKDFLFGINDDGDLNEINVGGIIFAIFFFLISILNYYQYLKTATADPGFINSMMFNKAYNETEISQNNLT